MGRLVEIAFGVAIAVLAAGLVLVLGSAAAAGEWWLARQPWIGLGLSATVVGLAGVHLTAPALIFIRLARHLSRGVAVAVMLVLAVGIAVGLSALRLASIEALVTTFALWAVVAVLITAAGRDRRSWLVAALGVPLTGLSAVFVLTWWVVAAVGGLMRSRVPGGLQPAADLIEDAGTLLYSRSDLALLVPGLPTLALVELALLAIGVARSSGAQEPSRPAAGGAAC